MNWQVLMRGLSSLHLILRIKAHNIKFVHTQSLRFEKVKQLTGIEIQLHSALWIKQNKQNTYLFRTTFWTLWAPRALGRVLPLNASNSSPWSSYRGKITSTYNFNNQKAFILFCFFFEVSLSINSSYLLFYFYDPMNLFIEGFVAWSDLYPGPEHYQPGQHLSAQGMHPPGHRLHLSGKDGSRVSDGI